MMIIVMRMSLIDIVSVSACICVCVSVCVSACICVFVSVCVVQLHALGIIDSPHLEFETDCVRSSPSLTLSSFFFSLQLLSKHQSSVVTTH